MGLPEYQTGFSFATIGLAYSCGSPIAGALGDKLSYRMVQYLGMILVAISFLFIGPTQFFGGFHNSVYMIFAGLFIVGFALSMCYTVLTPEIIRSTSLYTK